MGMSNVIDLMSRIDQIEGRFGYAEDDQLHDHARYLLAKAVQHVEESERLMRHAFKILGYDFDEVVDDEEVKDRICERLGDTTSER
jgi:hypothetical protein